MQISAKANHDRNEIIKEVLPKKEEESVVWTVLTSGTLGHCPKFHQCENLTQQPRVNQALAANQVSSLASQKWGTVSTVSNKKSMELEKYGSGVRL